MPQQTRFQIGGGNSIKIESRSFLSVFLFDGPSEFTRLWLLSLHFKNCFSSSRIYSH